MVDYKRMYGILFNAATDTIGILETQYPSDAMQQAIEILKGAQLKCEELYIAGSDD